MLFVSSNVALEEVFFTLNMNLEKAYHCIDRNGMCNVLQMYELSPVHTIHQPSDAVVVLDKITSGQTVLQHCSLVPAREPDSCSSAFITAGCLPMMYSASRLYCGV